MMQLSLSPRDRRTLLVGAIAIAGIAAMGKGVPALRRWQAASIARAIEAREQLALARSGNGSIGQLRDSSSARALRLDAIRATLLQASTPQAGASSLASLVETAAKDVEVDVLTVALRPDSAVRSGFARVSARLSAEGDVQGLADFLYAIETNDVPIIVRDLTLSQGDALAPPSRMETLRFDVVVETLVRIDGGGNRNRPAP